VAHNEVPERAAQAEQEKPFFAVRVVGVSNQKGIVIGKYCPGLFERYSVLPLVLAILPLIPIEPQLRHPEQCNYNVVALSTLFREAYSPLRLSTATKK
jgi:hypothetical protein